jgi:hypothetical protein
MKRALIVLGLFVSVALLETAKTHAAPPASHQKSPKSVAEEESYAGPPIRADGKVMNLLRAHDELPSAVWKRLLQVQTLDGAVVARYLIFNLHGTFFSYSPEGGSKRIWPAGRSAGAFARATSSGTFVTGVFFAPGDVVGGTKGLSLF